MRRGRWRLEDLTAERFCLYPVAGLAKYHGETCQAKLRHRLQRVRRAVFDGGLVSLSRGPVLACVLVGIGQPLINLAGSTGVIVLQRERQRGVYERERRGALTHPRADVALEPEHTRL